MRIAFFLLLLAGFFGFYAGGGLFREKKIHFSAEKEFPVVERKAFALVVYAYNDAIWCERALRSIFEQDYDYFRVVFIDDGSKDATFEKARSFTLENKQDHRVILIRNEKRLGPVGCLHRAIDNLLDREIAIPLNAKDWFSNPYALTRLNRAYQNPDVWLTFCASIAYPSYEISGDPVPCSFYSALFRQIRLVDLLEKGCFAEGRQAYLLPLLELAGKKVCALSEPLIFSNQARPFFEKAFTPPSSYRPLGEFPRPKEAKEKADLLLFSFNRPLQLYACLESVQSYMAHLEKISVIYRASTPRFTAEYEKVKATFPSVQFFRQSEFPKKDFKPLVLKALFNSPSEYILFGVDDIIVKDFTDLKLCMEMMEKTGAYGFYFRFGKHIQFCYQSSQPQSVPPSLSLGQNIYAWDLKEGEFDWGFPTSLDMTLYRKRDLKEAFKKMKYKTPNSLEFTWAKEFRPQKAIGLYFEQSRIVNLPLNVVSLTGNPHMNAFSPEELLAKFEQGLKIDIAPFYKIENNSPHFDYAPSFVAR